MGSANRGQLVELEPSISMELIGGDRLSPGMRTDVEKFLGWVLRKRKEEGANRDGGVISRPVGWAQLEDGKRIPLAWRVDLRQMSHKSPAR